MHRDIRNKNGIIPGSWWSMQSHILTLHSRL